MKRTKQKQHILVVEDNKDVRKVVSIYLKSNGYAVSEAADGQAGLDMAVSLKPDLVLYDVLLPKLDGIESLKKLRATSEGKNIPVVMMSAVLQTRDLQAETSHLNVSDFLQKPFQVRTLLKIINDAFVDKNNSNADNKLMARTSLLQNTTNSKTTRLSSKRVKLPTRGTLDDIALPHIIHSLFVENKTGLLRVVAGTTEKRIYFQNGFSVYAESSLPDETLGAHLVAKKRVTLEQHEIILEAMTKTGHRYGELLLKFNFINPHELFKEIEFHLAEKVITLFSWFQGQFKFEEGNSWKDDVIIARMKPGRIILDGIQRYWTSERIKAKINKIAPDKTRVFAIENSIYSDDQLAFKTQEARIFNLARKEESISTILKQLKNYDVAYRTLYALYVIEKIGLIIEKQPNDKKLTQSSTGSGAEKNTKSISTKKDFAQLLLAEYIQLRTANYYTLLGVSREASVEEITSAFKLKQKRYHPDSLVTLDSGLVHEKIEELFIKVQDAYRILIDDKKRYNYDNSQNDNEYKNRKTMLSARNKIGNYPKRKNKEKHELYFEDGFEFLRNAKIKLAVQLFKEAESIVGKPQYIAYRVWAEYLLSPGKNTVNAEKELKTLIKQNSNEALLFYILGNFYFRERRNSEAIKYFERALKIDPHHIDSARQLRILRMRSHSESAGLFDLFRKK